MNQPGPVALAIDRFELVEGFANELQLSTQRPGEGRRANINANRCGQSLFHYGNGIGDAYSPFSSTAWVAVGVFVTLRSLPRKSSIHIESNLGSFG